MASGEEWHGHLAVTECCAGERDFGLSEGWRCTGGNARATGTFALLNAAAVVSVPAMKRFAPVVLIVVILSVVGAPFALAAASNARAAAREGASPALPIAAAITTVTGIAISPLLGTGIYGAYRWLEADGAAERAALPWYAQMKFWLPALLIVGLCAAKDSLGATLPPGWKKPLDVLEALENKLSGLIAAGAVIPFTMDALSKVLIESAEATPGAPPGGLAMLPFGAIDWSWLLDILTVPFGVALFAVVWMASHAINVLILLSPWGAIDAALKAARTTLLGSLMLTATLNPWLGALLSAIVIVVAYFIAGWAFRLTVFGSVFCWDFFTRRRKRFVPPENDNRMFAGPDFPGVPVRTYGRLVQRTEGGLEFVYRPWLWLPAKMAPVPATPPELAVGAGFLFSDVVAEDGADGERTLFSLPPRYRGHEEAVARAYQMGGGVKPMGLHKAWSALREMLGGRAARSRPTLA